MRPLIYAAIAASSLAACADQDVGDASLNYEDSTCHLRSEPFTAAQGQLEEMLERIEGAKFEKLGSYASLPLTGGPESPTDDVVHVFVGYSHGDDLNCRVRTDYTSQRLKSVACHTCDVDNEDLENPGRVACGDDDIGFSFGYLANSNSLSPQAVDGFVIKIGGPYNSIFTGSGDEELVHLVLDSDNETWDIWYLPPNSPNCSLADRHWLETMDHFTSNNRDGRQTFGYMARDIIGTVTGVVNEVEEENNQ